MSDKKYMHFISYNCVENHEYRLRRKIIIQNGPFYFDDIRLNWIKNIRGKQFRLKNCTVYTDKESFHFVYFAVSVCDPFAIVARFIHQADKLIRYQVLIIT